MKILYIITQADGGGAQKYVLALAKHFKGAIAAGSEAQKLFEDAKNGQLTTYKLKHLRRNIHPWHDFWAMWEIRSLIKKTRPDIVHLNSTKAGVLGSFAAIGLKTKVIFTAHGFRFLEPMSFAAKNFFLTLEKIASAYRDFIITVSETDKKAALENGLISENKIQTVHNGIGQIDFLPKDEARKQLGLPLDKKIYGVIANDYATKGLDILEATKPVPGSLIAIIGKHSPNKKSSDDVKYLGYKPNASIYFKAFNATFIPSKKEGFPYSALEAMQAGQPIAATSVGGIPEALGNAGILVKPNDPKEFDRVMEVDFMDEARLSELSRIALERSKVFTEEKMLKATERVYAQILKE